MDTFQGWLSICEFIVVVLGTLAIAWWERHLVEMTVVSIMLVLKIVTQVWDFYVRTMH